MLKRIPIHPLLFIIFPVIALLGHNITEVPVNVIVRPLIIALAGMLVLFGAAYLALRDILKAGLVVTLFLALFFTYGQLYNFLKDTPPVVAGLLARHRYVIILYTGLFILGLIAILTSRKNFHNINLTLNLVGLVLLVVPVYRLPDIP
jgi:hypothetical protein